MLSDIGLIKRRILELNFKDCLDETSEDPLGQEGFLQVALKKPQKDMIKFNDKVFVLRFDTVIKAFVKDSENVESEDVKDALLIAEISIDFDLAYTHTLELELVEKLVTDEAWFFQRDARIFINEDTSISYLY